MKKTKNLFLFVMNVLLMCFFLTSQTIAFGKPSDWESYQKSYQRSCRNCNLKSGDLECECRNRTNVYIHTSIDAAKCRNSHPDNIITNDDGRLRCIRLRSVPGK